MEPKRDVIQCYASLTYNTLSCKIWSMVVFIFIPPKKPIKIKNDSIWKGICISKPTCHFKWQVKHRRRLEWKPVDRRKELGGKSDGPYFFKRMVLVLYGLMFITKEIRTVCLHIPKRKEEGEGNLGWKWLERKSGKTYSRHSLKQDVNAGF